MVRTIMVAFLLILALSVYAQQAPPRTGTDSALAGLKSADIAARLKAHQSEQHGKLAIDSVAIKSRAVADSLDYKLKRHQAVQHKRDAVDSSALRARHN